VAVLEKIPPRQLSLLAIAAAVAVTAALYAGGREKPSRYLVSMSINHHTAYGQKIECQACHNADMGLFKTSMNCLTGACHGDLNPATAPDEALRIALMEFSDRPDSAGVAAEHLKMHNDAVLLAMACTDCHTEHTERPVRWLTPEEKARARSLRASLGSGFLSLAMGEVPGNQPPGNTVPPG
jgi:hypothetical protein